MQQCGVQQETVSVRDMISLNKLQSLGKCHNKNMFSDYSCLCDGGSDYTRRGKGVFGQKIG
jgi:hypothetical protein